MHTVMKEKCKKWKCAISTSRRSLPKAGKWVVLVVMVGFVFLSVSGDEKSCI